MDKEQSLSISLHHLSSSRVREMCKASGHSLEQLRGHTEIKVYDILIEGVRRGVKTPS